MPFTSWLQRRRHERLVRRDQIVDSFGDPVLVLDRDRLVMDMNLAALRLADRPAGSSDWRGAKIETLIPFLREVAVTGADVAPSIAIDTADASYDVRVSRVRATRAAWLVVLRDVTAERKAILERERFVRQSTDLVSTVSHELRTPAAAIQGAVQLVLGSARSTLAPDDQALLEGALRGCERIAGIVHDILDISTIESRHPAGVQPVAIERLVIDALFDAGGLAAERTVRVETSLAKDLPLVHGDHDRLVHVFVTLLTTTIAAAPAGSFVTLRARRHEEWVVLDVQGDGNPLPPERFYSGPLALSRTIVEQHGGRLAAERDDLGGTRFVVHLRQSDDTRKQSPRVTPTTVFPRGRETNPPKDVRILVADDDPDLRDVVSETLQSQGFTVITAEDGVRADDILAVEAIDLAVIDLNMPNRTGGEVIRGIRSGTRQPGLPILVLTGSVNERETPDNLGADALLTKPTDLRRLVAEVKTLLERPDAAQGSKA